MNIEICNFIPVTNFYSLYLIIILSNFNFRNLIFRKDFLPFLHLFLKKEFLLGNNHMFSENDLQQSLKLILKDQSFFPLLKVKINI